MFLILLVLLTIIIVLLIIVLLAKVNFDITYTIDDFIKHSFLLKIGLFNNLIHYQLEIPLDKIVDSNKMGKAKEKKKQKGLLYKVISNWFRRSFNRDSYRDYFFRKTNIQRVSISTRIGRKDAAAAALLYAVAWGCHGVFLNYICQCCMSEEPELYSCVVPVFSENKFNMDFNCIFEVRTVHIIITAYNLRRFRAK